jgi:molecular chaperone DnaK
LTQEEIDAAIKDAELHAEEDKKKKDLIDARNHADSLLYATEKSLKDLGKRWTTIRAARWKPPWQTSRPPSRARDLSDIQAKSEALTQASHKLAEAMYQQTAQAEQGPPGADAGSQDTAGGGSADDDVVDADFEEVKEDDKK